MAELPSVQGLDVRRPKGSGSCGCVYQVTVNGFPCIAKRLVDILNHVSKRERSSVRRRFREECILLSQLRHPNIVQFIGEHCGQEQDDLTLLMEGLYMDLDGCLKTYQDISLALPIKLAILLDVAGGLLYLHTQDPPIIHRDLTAGNVLLTNDLKAKLADLGVSKILNLHPNSQISQIVCPGRLGAMPPEALIEKPIYGTKFDNFSFGTLALHIANQEFPAFYETDQYERGKKHIAMRQCAISEMGETYVLYQVVIKCLQDDPEERPTTAKIHSTLENLTKKHPKQFKDAIEMLTAIKEYRKGLDQVQSEFDQLKTTREIETETLQREKEELQKEVKTQGRNVTGLTADLKKRENEVEKLEREKGELQKEMNIEVVTLTAAMQEKIEVLQAENRELQKKVLDYQIQKQENQELKCHTTTDVERLLIFSPNVTHYSSHFAIKAKIELDSKLEETLNVNPFNFQLDFHPVRSDICQILQWYGVHQVGKLLSPPEVFMEVQFASYKALRKFLHSKQKVETAIKENMTARFHAVNPQDLNATFETSIELFLVTPNATNRTIEFREVSLANHRNCVTLYMKSKIAELPTRAETVLITVPEDVLTERDLAELVRQLHDVAVDWFKLGQVLQIPYSQLQIFESDFMGVQSGRTVRLLTSVLEEWMKNHQEKATWSTVVLALSAIGKRPSARRIAHKYGVRISDESVHVLDDLSPEESEKLQQVLEEIKLINSKSGDQQLIQIQKLIEDAQKKKQITLETLCSILKDTVSKVKMLLIQKENLEGEILKKERQLSDEEMQLGKQEDRKTQVLEKTATSLKQELSELKQRLLETDQELITVRVIYNDKLREMSAEISALSLKSDQLMNEKETLATDISRKIMLIESLESLNTTLTQLSTTLKHNLDTALQLQQQQEERYKHDVAALHEKLKKQQKQDEQNSRTQLSHGNLKCLEQLSDNTLEQLASVIEMDLESNKKVPVMNKERLQEIIMPCLGRLFQHGMLYDCCTDQLVSSVILWNPRKLKQGTLVSIPEQLSAFKVIADNSIDTQFSKLGINVDLKLSILGGLVNFSGAATYLNDQVSSMNQVRVSLKCESTVRVEQLAIEKLGDLDNPGVFKDTTATHFVSGILYGADAIFIFDREVQPNEDFHDVHEFMKSMVEKLPTVSTSGNAALDISDTDKKKVQKFLCKLYCDLPLPENPTTFEEAAKLCKDLPRLLSASNSPKKVWLSPLSKLNREVLPITLEISVGLVNQTQKLVAELHEVEMRSNDLINSNVCICFPGIKEQLSCFKGRIAEYKAGFVKKLTTLLPQVRRGSKGEDKLAELFTAQHATPFSHKRLLSWVEGKTKEIKVLANYLNSMQGIEFAFLPGNFESVIADPEHEFIISLTFNVAGRHNLYLDEMTTYLYTQKMSQEVMNPTPWYSNPEIIRDIKWQIRLFKAFAKANEKMKNIKFVVTRSSSKQSDRGAVIELYDDVVKEIFEPPSQPGMPHATRVTHNSIQVSWSKPKYGAQNVKFYTVFYRDHSSSLEQWKTAKTNSTEESMTAKDLDSLKNYCFKVHAESRAGFNISEISNPIQTSILRVPPGKPIASNVTHISLELKWSTAQYRTFNVDFYTVLYHQIKDSSYPEQWVEKVKTTEQFTKVTGLAGQSLYSFKVSAQFSDGTCLISDASDSIQTDPYLQAPGKPTACNVTHNSLELEWSEAQYGEKNAEFYTILYRENKAPQLQWKESKTEGAKKLINGLAAKTLYSFKVRAEFKNGISLVSDVSDPIETYPIPMPPTKPAASSVTHNSIQLQWEKARYGTQNVKFYTVLYYELKYPPDSEPQWKEFKTMNNKESTVVDNLAAQTLYCFKVQAKFQDMQLVSQISDPIQTDPPPVNPGKPTASNVTHISLELTWTKAQYRACNADFYTVLYHQIKDSSYPEQWVKKGTSNEQFVKVTGLAGHSLYSFKVSAQFSDGTYLISDASDPIETDPYPVVPGKPTACNVTHNSIQLQWSKPQFGAQYVKFYTVFYQECNGPDHWIQRNSKPGQDEFLTVTRLGAKKAYVFKVHPKIVSDPSFISKMSDQSDPIETEDRIALQMLTRKPTKEGPLSVYRMPFEEGMKDTKKKIRKYFVGAKTVPWVSKEKVLMVVGATGAGKSTLINGMVNYIMGVDWEDPFRFKLIADEGHSQSKSQTKWITAYTLPKMVGSTVPYTLTIIDTPGFGDTEGLKQDKFITTQIKEFFSKSPPDGIDHIDAIGFVTQSALARLTPTQQYIFNSILAIFGKDVANNIFMMVTFADGQYPPVMTAIKDAKLPCANFYKFNNSALFADNKVDESDEEEPENFDQMFWKMGFSSFKKFFNDFQKAESKSLQLTKEVLDERERLEITVNGLQPQIRNGLSKIEEMRQEEAAVLKYEAEIATNKDFTYSFIVTKQRRISLEGTGIYVLNCLQCNYICQESCRVEDIKRCRAMGSDGNCKMCPRKCHWSQHVNNRFKYETYTEVETRTSDDLKRKYDQAMTGRTVVEKCIAVIDAQLRDIRTAVLTNIKTIQQCQRRLDEIALKPNPLAEVELLELLITSERQMAMPGWTARVQHLEDAKEQAVMLQHVQVEDAVEQLESEDDPQKQGTKSKSWYDRFKHFKAEDMVKQMERKRDPQVQGTKYKP